ncbi:MAG: hypothetical protein WCA11_17960 [Terracidiphilus sp.]
MRCLVSFGFLALVTAVAVPAAASSLDTKPADQESIAALEVKIGQAQPREQCYLYAELIHQMTEFSLQQYSAGDVQKANSMLKQVQLLAHKLHLSVADNDKRLKNAEILLRHTAFRLNEMLHSSSYEDRPLLEQTLAQVNQADNEAMLQVFKK